MMPLGALFHAGFSVTEALWGMQTQGVGTKSAISRKARDWPLRGPP
jgi:hypothetical protein